MKKEKIVKAINVNKQFLQQSNLTKSRKQSSMKRNRSTSNEKVNNDKKRKLNSSKMGNKNSKIRLNINSSDLQHKRIFLTDKNTPANTIANNDNFSNKKSNRQFLKKYSARSELINKEGVKGIMLSPSQKKIKLPNKSTSQKAYLPPINQQFQPLQRNRISYVNSELIYNPIQPNQKEDGRRFPNVLSIDNQFYTTNDNNSYEIIQDYNNYQDRSYVPYTLKDYNKHMNEFKSNRFGGIGDNKGSADWKNRFIKHNKMITYGNNVFSTYVNSMLVNKKSPKEEMEMNKKQQYEKSTWFKTKKYGNGVMLNKLRLQRKMENEQRKMLEEELRMKELEIKRKEIERENEMKRRMLIIKAQEEEKLLSGGSHKVMNEMNRNQYMINLRKLKESLITDF